MRAFLDEFLSDPMVVDYPRWLWRPILARILRTRPARVAEQYRAIWTDEGSPLETGTRRICDALAKKLELESEVRFRVPLRKSVAWRRPRIFRRASYRSALPAENGGHHRYHRSARPRRGRDQPDLAARPGTLLAISKPWRTVFAARRGRALPSIWWCRFTASRCAMIGRKGAAIAVTVRRRIELFCHVLDGTALERRSAINHALDPSHGSDRTPRPCSQRWRVTV